MSFQKRKRSKTTERNIRKIRSETTMMTMKMMTKTERKVRKIRKKNAKAMVRKEMMRLSVARSKQLRCRSVLIMTLSRRHLTTWTLFYLRAATLSMRSSHRLANHFTKKETTVIRLFRTGGGVLLKSMRTLMCLKTVLTTETSNKAASRTLPFWLHLPQLPRFHNAWCSDF